MKKQNIKKLVALCAMSAMVVGSTAVSFADTKTTPVNLSVEATSIDFSISEVITAEATAEDTDGIAYSDLTVTNNSNMGVLQVTEVKAEAASDWTLKADSTIWSQEKADAKAFSMVTENGKDLSTGSDDTIYDINPTQADKISFTGNTGMVTTEVAAQKIADVTVTVSYK